MNNWRLLLLAVVVVVQPIGSFTESNLIDGGECCERTEDVRFYGTGRRSLDGNREDRRSTDERRLKLLDESRGWRYERSVSRSENTKRRLSLESSRYPRDQAYSRATSRKVREDLSRNRDESRSSVGQVERDTRKSRSRDAVDTTRSVRLSRDARDTRSIRQSRDSVSRLPIRNSRDLENHQVSGRDTADSNREREVVARSSTRRDTRQARSDSRIQLENNKDRRAFDRNTQANRENQRFSNAKDSEIRLRMSNVRNNREVRTVRAELRRQRDIEFRARMITDNRDTARILDSRDSERFVQNRIDARINGLERHGCAENRSFMDTLRNTRSVGNEVHRSSLSFQLSRGETRDARLTINSEKNTQDDSSINRDETSDVRRQQRENRRGTVSTDRTTISLYREQLKGNNKILDSRRRVAARRDSRESLDERRQQRDNTRQRSMEITRDRRETGRTEESRRAIRDSSEERRLQRDSSSRKQQSREIRSSDLRRQILERGRGLERAIRMSRSAERRQGVREIRATRSVENVRDVTTTTNNIHARQQTRQERQQTNVQRMNHDAISTQRFATRLPKTENTRHERVARNRNDVRRTDERDQTERVVVRATQNVESPQRLASRGSERREVRRDDTRFDRRRSSERVQAGRRQDIRDARNEMSRNREVQMDERLDSRRERDIVSRGSERVLAERRQNNREATQRDRGKIARNLNDVRVEKRKSISERQEESREIHSRDVRGEARIVEAERREGNSIARDSRDVRDERNIEPRRMLTRTQDNRDTRVVRDEKRGQRGNTRRSMITVQRNLRVADRLNEREFRPETQKERMTRNIERQNQHDIDNRRQSRIEMRSNARIETSRFPLRDESLLKHQGGSRNVDVTSEFVETEEPVDNWKLALYTLQGIYLCGLLMQILTEKGSKPKKRSFNWWSSHKDLIKVD